MCSGHSQNSGDYHYHFPPSCLISQVTTANPITGTYEGHSPQIGWAYDGFPIYGPLKEGGTAIAQSELDSCSGREASMPDLDDFAYRYYFTGSTSNLYALPTHPKACVCMCMCACVHVTESKKLPKCQQNPPRTNV